VRSSEAVNSIKILLLFIFSWWKRWQARWSKILEKFECPIFKEEDYMLDIFLFCLR
jgi:hypothetical protein